MSTEKKEVAKTVTMPKQAKPKTANTAKAEEKKLSITEILEAQLKEIQRKKQLADNRDLFLSKRTSLSDAVKVLKQLAIENVFETNEFELKFVANGDYRHVANFSISNPEMLLKFLVFLYAEIEKAISKIEEELLKDI